ncbi:MAG: NADH-quinone oxidoreductase subunit C, partial [Actinomycetota bacterium]|nr:NADH-quinone oxidoreductase subunit C [Actinomycetota bacterium]
MSDATGGPTDDHPHGNDDDRPGDDKRPTAEAADDVRPGDAAPGAAHHPSDDEAAAAEAHETAEAANDTGEEGGSGGGGASADAPAVADHAGDGPAGDGSAGVSRPELFGHPLTDSLGQAVVHCIPEGYLELCQALRDDGYDMMIGVTAVDYLVHPGRPLPEGIAAERFEVVVELASVTTRRRIRVRCQVRAADPTVPTLFDVWPGSEAHERETYDMYGIVFEGHPDPSRIL